MSDRTHPQSKGYGKAYYASHCGEVDYDRTQPAVMSHFRTFASTLANVYAPKRVLDVGCAKGFLVEHLRDAGVEAFGVDSSEYAISQVRDDVKGYCRLGSALDPSAERYDLVTCIEVAEHMPADTGPVLIANLCSMTDQVIFSSTPSDFAEPTHVNIRPPEYWRELFAQNGFFPDLRFEPNFITPHAERFCRLTRPLRVALFSKERPEWAVVRLRVLDPLRELEKQGRVQLSFISAYDKALPIERLLEADLFVVQREFAEKAWFDAVTRVARLLGKVIVFEIDDLLTRVPRSNPVYAHCARIGQDIINAVHEADFLTASTEPLIRELAQEARGVPEKSHLVRNCINTEIWGSEFRESSPAPGEPTVVGWFGSPTHKDDLAIVRDAIAFLARRYAGQVEFHFFGYLPEELADVPGVRLMRGPVADVVQHAKSVRAARIDIAIAPLVDHPFNHAKSDLKWLEYSICGIPGVYSRVSPYSNSITQHVDGIVVDNDTASWVAGLECLIEDEDLRRTMARRAFDTVRGNLCLDVTANQWDDLYRAFVVSGPREALAVAVDDERASEAAAVLFRLQAQMQALHGAMGRSVSSMEASLRLNAAESGTVARCGVQLASAGHLAAAERVLGAVVNEAPGTADGHLFLARLYRAVEDQQAAERTFERAAHQHPADPDLTGEHVDFLRKRMRNAEADARLLAFAANVRTAEEAFAFADQLSRCGRYADALAVVRKCQPGFPEVDFSALASALEGAAANAAARFGDGISLCRKRGADTVHAAVYGAEPVSTPHMQRRLLQPLRVLERAALAEVTWNDVKGSLAPIDTSSVVILAESAAGAPAVDAILQRARTRGIPTLFEVEQHPAEPGGDERCALVARADVSVFPSEALATQYAARVPEAAGRMRVIESALDVETWSGGRRWTDHVGRPFEIGLFNGYATPQQLRAVVVALRPLIEASRGRLALTSWSPFVAPGAPLPTSTRVGAASPFYREYARKLLERPLDLALVPVSPEARYETRSDVIAVELAAARVPALFSRRAPFEGTVIPGSTGFLVEDSPEAWKDAVADIVPMSELRRDVAERAWTIAYAERTVQQSAPQWHELLQGIARAPVAAAAEPALA